MEVYVPASITLNSQIKQQPYQLPLVPAALEELRGAQVFTKLDLRSAYNLVRIRAGDEWKTAFVTPTGHYEYRVMPYGLSISPSIFQTFMNEVFREFLHRFVVVCIDDILIYSRKLGRTSPARPADFYRRFIKDYSSITVPLTSLLRGKLKALIWNPSAHEAFQQLKEIFSTAPLLHHPDPELPFMVEVDAFTTGVGAVLSQAVDHRNLQYLREARRLNPRQARWALFFTRFNFKITYRPGSKNTSADALSRQFSADPLVELEPIIPSNLIISPILWEQDNNIRHATLQEPTPPECPEGMIFVPHSQRLTLLGTAHQSPGSGHPGKLIPLTIPQRPWSHIGVDFVTDLPGSEGNTCIPVMVDYFSKMCKFFPLRGLPTALETAEHLFQQLFCHFGLPEEIVSDRGPQFISHVWKAFFKLLGVSVNLSSGYHPQTNGQTERKIQELGRYLWAYCHEDQRSWSRFLPWAEYAQNSLRQDATGLTPFQCVLGYQPPLFPWTEEPSHVPAVDHWFRESKRVWD
ncbi:hypothetical protein M9458_055638 [Cirrhinus mrigala]|uniref:ribonuclease H n=1 Tax=Cirrhinus mrigala TaxID=683832 RepID=A0ABD0MIT9_CIRMR